MRGPWLSLALLVGLVGCAVEAPSPGPPTCFDYAAWAPPPEEVTFREQVLPIFRRSCGVSGACHGNELERRRCFLGPNLAHGEVSSAVATAIVNGLVDVPVPEASLPLVTAGDPSKSFLMYKLDGAFDCEGLACVDCGGAMPLSGPLADEERDLVRAWIAQGARDL